MGILDRIPQDRWSEIAGLLLCGLAVVLLLSYVSFGPARPLTFSNAIGRVGQTGGTVSSFVGFYSFLLVGQASFALPAALLAWGCALIAHRPFGQVWIKLSGLVFLILGLSGLCDLAAGLWGRASNVPAGGLLGSYIGDGLTSLFERPAALVVTGTIVAVSLLLTTELFFFFKLIMATLAASRWICGYVTRFFGGVRAVFGRAFGAGDARKAKAPRRQKTPRVVVGGEEKEPPAKKAAVKPVKKAPKEREQKGEPVEEVTSSGYVKPPMSLLDVPSKSRHQALGKDLRATSEMLEDALRLFGVEADVVQVTRGPTITRYELEPEPGTKVAKFMSLADDLALALKAHRVRIEAPIPGKGRVGVEVPNDDREDVCLGELLSSSAFRKSRSKLTLTLGKDIAGDPVVVDLGRMPHLLIAGATGAGKTVCVKTIIASILFNATPAEVEMLMIDPKMVELSIFNGIPHLISPVVTEPKRAAASLDWLIREMEQRYKLFTEIGLRNIDIYNEKVRSGELAPDVETLARCEELLRRCVDTSGKTPKLKPLPYIVVIIDEMADLMMIARADVEDAILRLAQLARAVGIHLVIATQRPSVDVVTGVIKANFTHRIAFQVTSKVDSRTILDMMGAERLIGAGDMLYLPAGSPKPLRTQGAFVSDKEMSHLIEHLKTQGQPRYRAEVMKWQEDYTEHRELMGEQDELYETAVRVVMETGKASTSMVQRRLRVGYNRAARLVDAMEQNGLVGPAQGSQPREILRTHL